MLTLSKVLKTTVFAALIGIAGTAVATPASAHGFDGRGGYHRDRDSGYGDRDDRDDRGGRWGHRHDRDDRGGRWGHRHDRDDRGWRHRHYRHRGWY